MGYCNTNHLLFQFFTFAPCFNRNPSFSGFLSENSVKKFSGRLAVFFFSSYFLFILLGKRKEERGKRKEERGKREEERGKREEGEGKEGRGKRKEERGKRKEGERKGEITNGSALFERSPVVFLCNVNGRNP